MSPKPTIALLLVTVWVSYTHASGPLASRSVPDWTVSNGEPPHVRETRGAPEIAKQAPRKVNERNIKLPSGMMDMAGTPPRATNEEPSTSAAELTRM